MKRILTLLAFVFLLNQSATSQEQLGWMNDNYAGVNGIDLQPASIVDSRFKFDMSIFHLNASFANNYVGIKRQLFKDMKSDSYNDNGDFQGTYMNERINSHNKNIYMNIQSSLPIMNFMVTINQKNAFAITTKSRFMMNIDNVEPQLAKLSWESLNYPQLWKTNLKNEKLNINSMAWSEIGITYGREIITIKDHYLKGALRAKYLIGHMSAYMFSENLEYNFTNDDTLSIYNTDVSYGLAANLDDKFYNDFSADKIKDYIFTANPSFGFDFGFVYEWRKNATEKYQYEMDGKTDNWRRDQNKYKLKAGFSVIDLGRIKFDKNSKQGNFFADIRDWDISNFSIDGIDAFNDTLDVRFTDLSDDNSYKMQLPTTISYQIDYRIWKPFYINHTGYISVNRYGKDSRVRNITTYSIAPRIEHKWVGLSIPYSYQPNFQRHQLGAMLRLGPLVVGTNDLLNFAGKDVIYGGDFYVALKLPIMYKKPKDKDGDKVSNRKDKCKKEPGPWENRGCPEDVAREPEPPADRDGDGVPDVADQCIDVPGPVENNGCPYGDKDGDGVLDNVDQCIDVPGPVENNGCPYGDKDGDGVLDSVDECIDVPGPKENNGCPYSDRDRDGIFDKDDKCPDAPGPVENDGCPWLDTDGDGVLDKDDECPLTPGPFENKGCPVIEKQEQEILDKAFDNLEFETGKAVIKFSSYDELDALAELLKSKSGSKLKIAGHTDNVGSDASNLQLSKIRAEAVRNYLVKKGVPMNRFIVEFFGESQPIADNATPEGRAKNRRVEMLMIFE
jgi:outer membrane protein OmpA-like peptidoglycan-associated protein